MVFSSDRIIRTQFDVLVQLNRIGSEVLDRNNQFITRNHRNFTSVSLQAKHIESHSLFGDYGRIWARITGSATGYDRESIDIVIRIFTENNSIFIISINTLKQDPEVRDGAVLSRLEDHRDGITHVTTIIIIQ